MARSLVGVSGVLAAAGVFLITGCGSDDAVTEPAPSSPSITVEATKLRFRDEIAGTAPAGVFLELHYLLASESDSEVLFAQGDLQLESASGRSYPHSPEGLAAWMRESPGYNLTEAVRLSRGSHPRPWVTVFDLPASERGSAFAVRFQQESAVAVPDSLHNE